MSDLYPALVKSQSEFPKIVKSSSIKETTSRQGKKYGGYSYADLPSILDAITPVLNKNGLFLHQRVDCVPDGVKVETVVFDGAGNSLSGGHFFVSTAGLTQSGAQAFGSALTYARRYSLTAFFSLGADDDDGSAAIGWNDAQIYRPQPPVEEAQKPQVKPLNLDQTLAAFRKAGNLKTLNEYYASAKSRATPEQMDRIQALYDELKPVYEDFLRQGLTN